MGECTDSGCQVERVAPPAAGAEGARAEAELLIDGMGCRNCATRISNALVGVAGVSDAEVSLRPPVATVRYDPDRASLDELMAAVADAGAESHHRYRAKLVHQVWR